MAAISGLDIRRVSQPALEELRDKTRETTSLAVLEGTMIRFIECYEGLSTVRIGNRTGVVQYAHVTAAGKAMLAALSDIELHRRYPGEELPAPMPASISSRRELMTEITQIRRQGYALNWEESSDGVAAVSVALRGAGRRDWRRSASRCRDAARQHRWHPGDGTRRA